MVFYKENTFALLIVDDLLKTIQQCSSTFVYESG